MFGDQNSRLAGARQPKARARIGADLLLIISVQIIGRQMILPNGVAIRLAAHRAA
jgi:hypothetical protein